MWKQRFSSSREDQGPRNRDSGLHISDLSFFGRSKKKTSSSSIDPQYSNFSRSTSRADSVSTTRSFRPSTLNSSQYHPEGGLRSKQSFTSGPHTTLNPAYQQQQQQQQQSSARTKPWQASSHSNRSQTSFNFRAGRNSTAMMDLDRARTRRERTFVGSACAVCEEPLEHTLRGERILQFSCTHVSHEACFYEYIKEFDSQYCPTCNAPLGLDTSRGGNVLDIEKLSNIVRSASVSDGATTRSSLATPTPWETRSNSHQIPPDSARSYQMQNHQHHQQQTQQTQQSSEHNFSRRDSRDTSSQRDRIERLTSPSSRRQPSHSRHDSGNTGVASSGEYNDGQQQSTGRRHDYDVQAMESDLSPRSGAIKNPIPAPIVTVRSEFPTLNRSRQQQPLTCLVTVEVPDGHWRPDMEDLRLTPLNAQLPPEELYLAARSPIAASTRSFSGESRETLDEIAEDLRVRVDNWHGLEFSRFGKLLLHGSLRVGKDRESWQELECFLFGEMLICVKEKKVVSDTAAYEAKRKGPRCSLKGSILIKKHLREVETSGTDDLILTLNLIVSDLPCFHLRFPNKAQLDMWRRALTTLHNSDSLRDFEGDSGIPEEDDYRTTKNTKRQSSTTSSYGASKSNNTALTEYTNPMRDVGPASFHVPLDLVVVIPVSSSMQGLKITLLRDALKFLVQNLGPRDRMGLVTFGSSGGGVPLVGMTTKAWNGWGKILNSLRPVGQKSLRADVVEGANVAMDLLMQRKSNNPISTILLISDSSTSDPESVDFVVSRAEAAKVGIHSFGLGLTHKPDTLIELSTRTKACYTYVKDWMMLRECVAGCLGSLQSTSHQNVKLKLRLPEGSPAKFVKISGALHTTKRATGKDAEAALGDLRFGDKRDILVQLVIQPDNATQEHVPQDPWQSLVSGLEALGGGSDGDEQRVVSVEEVPLIQADLTYGDILREGHLTHSPRPSLLAITMLPPTPRPKHGGRPSTPPIPPHPSIVQRRMELLASDMLTRALTLVSRGQHDRAQHLLTETRSILKGLGKGGLPPLPPGALALKPHGSSSIITTTTTATTINTNGHLTDSASSGGTPTSTSPRSSHFHENTSSSAASETATITPVAAVDQHVMAALDADLEAALEWINHPAVFGRDSRKAVLQAIGVVSSQRAFTYRTPSESLWSDRVAGVKRLTNKSKAWREMGDDALTEE